MRLLVALVILLTASIPQLASSQVLCTPLGSSTYCAGWNSEMKDVASTVTPLGNGSSLITGNAPVMAPSLLSPSVVDRPRHALPRMTPLPSLLHDRPSLGRGLETIDLERGLGLPSLDPLGE